MPRNKQCIWKGMAAGLIGGFAGAVVMTQFQNASSALLNPPAAAQQRPMGEPATVNAAETLSEKFLGRPLENREKAMAGNLVHYGFGTLSGAAYGAIVEVAPKASACGGVLLALTLFAVADEGLVPLLGWSNPPNQYPLSSHLYALASHLVYGFATDGVRRLVRKAI